MTDSRIDTYQHIMLVQRYLLQAIANLQWRLLEHDTSKLDSPEREAYDEIVPRLAGLEYGSEEYKATLREMKPALRHHFEANPHHPEHYDAGVNGMSLFDLLEMVCDWVAASQRGARSVDSNRYTTDMLKAMEVNRERFGLSDQLVSIIVNTYRELGVVASEGAHDD